MTNSLYQKYRPKYFNEIIGQHIPLKILENSLLQNKIHHAFIFSGSHGVGKTTISRILSKSLNCKSREGIEPCNKCERCKSIDSNSSLSVFEIDGASNNGVEDIKSIITSSAYLPQDSYKIFAIDEAQMLTKAAFNALLKTLEETNGRVVFILLTTELNKIPETIISRSLLINFLPISVDQMNLFLKSILIKENIDYDEKILNYISTFSSGSLRDALTVLQSAILYSEKITEKTICELLQIPTNSEINKQIENNFIELNNAFFDSINVDMYIKQILNLLNNTQHLNLKKDLISIYTNSNLDFGLKRILLFNTIKSFSENVSRETTTSINKTDKNVSRETIQIDTKKVLKTENDIVKKLKPEFYISTFLNNDTDSLKSILNKWLDISKFSIVSEYEEIISYLSSSKPIAIYKTQIIVLFEDDFSYSNFIEKQSYPNISNLLNDLLGSKYIILPIKRSKYEDLQIQAAKLQRNAEKYKSILLLDEIIGEQNEPKLKNIGLHFFGNKFKHNE